MTQVKYLIDKDMRLCHEYEIFGRHPKIGDPLHPRLFLNISHFSPTPPPCSHKLLSSLRMGSGQYWCFSQVPSDHFLLFGKDLWLWCAFPDKSLYSCLLEATRAHFRERLEMDLRVCTHFQYMGFSLLQELSDTSWVSYDSTHFWHHLPGWELSPTRLPIAASLDVVICASDRPAIDQGSNDSLTGFDECAKAAHRNQKNVSLTGLEVYYKKIQCRNS